MSFRFTLLILITLLIAACVPATPPPEAGPTPHATATSELESTATTTVTPSQIPTPAAPAPTVEPEVSFEVMAQYGGRAQAVAVEGGIAYLGIGPYLLALNVGDPAEPRRLGRSRLLSGIVEDLAVANDKVYAAAGDAGLRVIDVTDPTRPRETGGVRLPGHAEHLVIHENVAYVVTTQDRPETPTSDLRVIDVSDAAAPHQVAVVALPGEAYAILCDDNYVYVAHASGLSIFDVTEPAQPREIALVRVRGPAYDVAVAGNTAYVPSEDLVVIDVSNPASANIVGRWKGEPPEELDTIAVVGDRLYTYGSYGEWGYIFIDGYVLDISDPAAPQKVGRASLAWEDVAVQGTRLFTAAGAGLHIWNLEEPGEFTPVGQFRPDQPAYVGELTLAGNHAFAATDDGIGIFDVYDPAAIRPISTITGTAFVNELALAGDTLLVSSWRDGLSAFDVADPAAPRPLEVTDSRLRRGGTDDVAVADDHALVAVDDGLLTVDLSAPQALRVSEELYVDSNAGTRVTAEEDYAYYLTATVPTGGTTIEYGTLHVVDVSRLAAPRVAGSVDIPAYAQDVAVKEGYAYVVGEISQPACCSGWLTIVDVTQPAAPRQVTRMDLPVGAYAVHLEGSRAYVAAGASGLWVFDVSRPAAPRAIGHVDTPGDARHVTVQDDTVYVSDGAGGLLVLSQASVDEGSNYSNYWDRTRIAIVWPHDGQGHPTPMARSQVVNVSVWPVYAVFCDRMPTNEIVLWQARNNDPAEPLTTPELIHRHADGYRFPTLEFNNVPADLVADPDPMARYTFFAGWTSNVWVHAADPRTFYPHPLLPTGLSQGSPDQVDVRIQRVWPHDAQGNFAPVEQARYVNIAVDVFEHGTLKSVRPDDPTYGPVLLYIAEENEPMHFFLTHPRGQPKPAEKMTYTANGHVFPRWVFNDVPVEPGQVYHFIATVLSPVKELTTFPMVWTHASAQADVRTRLPHPQPPYYTGENSRFYHCEP